MNKLPELKNWILRYGLAMAFLLFAVLSSLSAVIVWKTYQRHLEQSHRLIAIAIGNAMEEFLDQPQKQIELVARLVEMEARDDIRQAILASALESDPRIRRFLVMDKRGIVTQVVPFSREMLHLDMSGNRYFQTPSATGQKFWSPAFISPLDNVNTIAFTVPIGQEYLTAFLTLERMADFQLPKELTPGTRLYVTDQNGNFLLHPDMRKVYEREVFSLYSLLPSDSLLQTRIRTEEGNFFCTGLRLPRFDWGIFLMQPTSMLMEPVYVQLRSLGLAFLLLTSLSLLVAWIGFRRGFGSFQAIVEQMRELGAGNRAQSLPPAQFQEFASITEQFNRMSLQIQEREESQRSLYQSLNQKNKELESILYISSHDLRTPLVNIAGFARELEDCVRELGSLATASPEKSQLMEAEIPQAFSYIHKALNQMDRLQRGIIRLARLKRTPLQAVPVPLEPLLQGLVEELQPLLNQAQGICTLGVLPTVLGSPQDLRQVFGILLDNAIRYTPPSQAPRIDIYASLREHEAVIHVQDHGIGIADSNLSLVFTPFFQVGELPGVEGEGLGLTIAQRIVEGLHGDISLRSSPGQGSEFLVTLPLA